MIEKYNDVENVKIIIVGNKVDHINDVNLKREVKFDDAKQYAISLKLPYVETSTKYNINIDQIFMYLASETMSEIVNKKKKEKSKKILDKINSNDFLNDNNDKSVNCINNRSSSERQIYCCT